ncbi:MAG: methyltransferase domain-containing protein [Cytophagia bacterium]|nr:methyltransferase domain-containing protein [Cytophagia bacterium]
MRKYKLMGESHMQSDGFECDLINALQPIKNFALSTSIFHLFETGIFDFLKMSEGAVLNDISSKLDLNHQNVEAFLYYLNNEKLIEIHDLKYKLTAKCLNYEQFRPWYQMLIGGYGQTLLSMGESLQNGNELSPCNSKYIGKGSCGISQFDAIPLIQDLVFNSQKSYSKVLDIGCGNGLLLIDLCQQYPEIEALGIDTELTNCNEANNLVNEFGLKNRVKFLCKSGIEFFNLKIDFTPDCVIFGFVLHEMLSQIGENALVDGFKAIISSYPNVHIIVIEIDDKSLDAEIMQKGLGNAYYNPYYLIHAFTCQALKPVSFWESFFESCGLEILRKQYVNQNIDSTNIEVGYLLNRKS